MPSLRPPGLLRQVVALAAIVATLLYLPVCALLAIVLLVFGLSPRAVVTFGGGLAALPGLLAWWLIFFVLSCVYAACAFPWREAHMKPGFRSR